MTERARLRATGFWVMVVVAAAGLVVMTIAAVTGSWRGATLWLLAAGFVLAAAFRSFRTRPSDDASASTDSSRSLVLRRMSLDRQRTEAIGGMVVVVLTAGLTTMAAASSGQLDGFVVAGFAAGMVTGAGSGVVSLREHARARRRFESQHGADAGKQEPV